jgi:hypothetical protein
VTKHQAIQAHYVPSRVYYPNLEFDDDDNLDVLSILDATVTQEPEINIEYESEAAEDGANIPVGGTAQNNYAEVRTFKCRLCSARVKEFDLDAHECED